MDNDSKLARCRFTDRHETVLRAEMAQNHRQVADILRFVSYLLQFIFHYKFANSFFNILKNMRLWMLVIFAGFKKYVFWCFGVLSSVVSKHAFLKQKHENT